MTKQRRPMLLQQFEKIAQEAWEHGQDPMVALRYYDPNSILSGSDGYIDLTVRLAEDDSVREASYNASDQ